MLVTNRACAVATVIKVKVTLDQTMLGISFYRVGGGNFQTKLLDIFEAAFTAPDAGLCMYFDDTAADDMARYWHTISSFIREARIKWVRAQPSVCCGMCKPHAFR
jgi:hypothetical protein